METPASRATSLRVMRLMGLGGVFMWEDLAVLPELWIVNEKYYRNQYNWVWIDVLTFAKSFGF